jgi:asparagine synthase (glutamine-hydrolysing)
VCGIIGQCEHDGQVDPVVFDRMIDSLAKRGPDGRGARMLAAGSVALGHRRLSIIDLSAAGHQPMANEDQTVWLTFNGEIYNYRELRRKLRQLGHKFRSESDSEVIVHGYEQWGDDVVDHLYGIFAFGIWDETRHRLLVARDHFGVKPLYYSQSSARLIFASQPRGILEHPQFFRAVDMQALQHYLAYRYVPWDQAIFDGMQKLPAAHRLIWEHGSLRTERYWEPSYRPEISDPTEALSAVQTTVREAVRAQLASDVPVGVFLSGGIDSSGIAAIAAAESGQSHSSYTMGFDDSAYDERRYARLAAAHAGCRGNEDVMDVKRFLTELPTFVELYDEPFFDYSGLFVHLLSRMARREGTPVVLAGDGGDEVFAGYRWYENPLECVFPGRMQMLQRRLGLTPRGNPLTTWFHRLCQLDTDAQHALLCRPGSFSHRTLMERFFRTDVPTVTGLQLLDLQTFMVDDILQKVDHASMACGVEVRVPFLDRSVVETAFSVHHDVLMHQGERKSLLKRALAPWLPPEILTSRKKGFGAPLPNWMASGLGEVARRLLIDGSLVQRNLFSPQGIELLLQQHQPQPVWLVLCIELWARRWLDGASSPSMQRDVRVITEDVLSSGA